MPVDIRVALPHVPGMLLKVTRALGDAEIDIQGFGADIRTGEQWGFMHLLVEDAEAAARALDTIGVEVLDVHRVEVVDVRNAPGGLADVAERYYEAGDSIEVLYLAGDGRLVVGTESMRSQRLGVRMERAEYAERSLDD